MATPNYGLLNPVQAPSLMDSRMKAANLSSMAMNQERGQKQMAREDQEAAHMEHLRKASVFGNALEGLAGISEQDRPVAYERMRSDLLKNGVMRPEDIPEQYDGGYVRQSYAKFQNSKEGIENRLKQAQIAKLEREAKQGPSDPLARQMAMADYKDGLDRKKTADMQAEELRRNSNIGGWKLAEGATPTTDDAKKFKSGASAARALLENLNTYQSLLNEHGTELGGKTAEQMKSLVRDIQLGAKNEDLYSLGVLTGPDLALLEEIVGTAPTGVMSKLNPMEWGGRRAKNNAQQFRENLNSRINAKAKTYGFEPQEEWTKLAGGGDAQKEKPRNGFGPSAVAGEMPAPPAGMIRMQAPDGSVRLIPEAMKGEAIAAGGKVVK